MASRLFTCLLFLVSYGQAVEVNDELFAAIVNRLSAVEEKVARQDDVIEQLHVELEMERSQTKSHQALIQELIDAPRRRRQLNFTEGPVAFSAGIKPRSLDHLQSKQPFTFDSVLTNIGNGYDKSTGIFTVPLPGIYLFTCSVLDHISGEGHGTTMVHAEIVRNGDVMARAFAHANDIYRDQGAQTIIAQVNQGDRIWIRAIDNNNLGLGGELYTTFSGYLLWQTE